VASAQELARTRLRQFTAPIGEPAGPRSDDAPQRPLLSRRARPHRLLDPGGHILHGQRPAQEEALHAVAAELAQLLQRHLVFDSGGGDRESELVRELDGRAHDQRIAGIDRHAGDAGLVDLELVQRQTPQVRDGGIPVP